MRVPVPYNFLEGVLLMELVTGADGDAAPRLNDVEFSAEDALAHHRTLITEVVRMLCAGVVHGDLSEFNILIETPPGVADTDGMLLLCRVPRISPSTSTMPLVVWLA